MDSRRHREDSRSGSPTSYCPALQPRWALLLPARPQAQALLPGQRHPSTSCPCVPKLMTAVKDKTKCQRAAGSSPCCGHSGAHFAAASAPLARCWAGGPGRQLQWVLWSRAHGWDFWPFSSRLGAESSPSTLMFWITARRLIVGFEQPFLAASQQCSENGAGTAFTPTWLHN